MNRAIIVNSGLDKINDANENGVKIRLYYYLPMYDSRIGKDTEIEEVVDVSASSPEVGDTEDDEIYWKSNWNPIEGYEVNEEYPENRDLYVGISFGMGRTESEEEGEDDEIKSVYTIDTSLSLNPEIPNEIKTNKIAIYGVLEGTGGNLTEQNWVPSNPFLFGYCIFNEPLKIHSESEDESNMTLLIDFSFYNRTSPMDYSETLPYTDDGNYWKRAENNRVIYHEGSAYISKTSSINDRRKYVYENLNSVSKLFSTVFNDEDYLNMVLQYVDDEWEKKTTNFKIIENNGKYHLEVDNTLYPKYTNEYGIGKSDNRWNHCYISNVFRLYKDNDEFSDDKKHIEFDLDDNRATFNDVDVYCNKNFYGNINSDIIKTTWNYNIKIDSSGNIIFKAQDEIESHRALLPKHNNITLGSDDNFWDEIYVNNIRGDNQINIHSNLIPNSDNLLNLRGDGTQRWQNLFCEHIVTRYINMQTLPTGGQEPKITVNDFNTNEISISNIIGNYIIAIDPDDNIYRIFMVTSIIDNEYVLSQTILGVGGSSIELVDGEGTGRRIPINDSSIIFLNKYNNLLIEPGSIGTHQIPSDNELGLNVNIEKENGFDDKLNILRNIRRLLSIGSENNVVHKIYVKRSGFHYDPNNIRDVIVRNSFRLQRSGTEGINEGVATWVENHRITNRFSDLTEANTIFMAMPMHRFLQTDYYRDNKEIIDQFPQASSPPYWAHGDLQSPGDQTSHQNWFNNWTPHRNTWTIKSPGFEVRFTIKINENLSFAVGEVVIEQILITGVRWVVRRTTSGKPSDFNSRQDCYILNGLNFFILALLLNRAYSENITRFISESDKSFQHILNFNNLTSFHFADARVDADSTVGNKGIRMGVFHRGGNLFEYPIGNEKENPGGVTYSSLENSGRLELFKHGGDFGGLRRYRSAVFNININEDGYRNGLNQVIYQRPDDLFS